MRKFLKSVVAAVLVASMSATGLAPIASAKTTTSSSSAQYSSLFSSTYKNLPKSNTFTSWACIPLYDDAGYCRPSAESVVNYNFSENDSDIIMNYVYGSGVDQRDTPLWYGDSTSSALYAYAACRYYTIEELSEKGKDCFKNSGNAGRNLRDASSMKNYTGYTPANTAWYMAFYLDNSVRLSYYSIRPWNDGRDPVSFYTFADLFWYLKQYCGYTDAQMANFKSDAKLYLKYHINPYLRGAGQREYTDAEIEKYWNVIIAGFSYDEPTYDHSTAGTHVVELDTMINVLDLKEDEVFWDLFGHALTKQDMLNGNLPVGDSSSLSYVYATSAAKKIMGDTVNDWVIGATAKECYKKDFKVVAADSVTTTSDSKSSTPTLTKSAKTAKTQLSKLLKGLKAGTITITNTEYKKLRTLYKAVDMPSSVVKGKTFNKNLKIALVQKLNYALPYMTAKQVSSLRSQLKAILA